MITPPKPLTQAHQGGFSFVGIITCKREEKIYNLVIYPVYAKMYYKKCVELVKNIIEEAKLAFPRAKNAIFVENVMGFAGMNDRKILNTSSPKKYSDKSYMKLYEKLKLIDIDDFIERIIQDYRK